MKETAFLLKDKETLKFSEQPTFWKIILEPTIGNVVISEADALTYVALSTAEKHMP
jgi:hypothetical protein